MLIEIWFWILDFFDSLIFQFLLDDYTESGDLNLNHEAEFLDAKRAPIFEKGQSKRIWGELYKVIDSSDILIQVGIS